MSEKVNLHVVMQNAGTFETLIGDDCEVYVSVNDLIKFFEQSVNVAEAVKSKATTVELKTQAMSLSQTMALNKKMFEDLKRHEKRILASNN